MVAKRILITASLLFVLASARPVSADPILLFGTFLTPGGTITLGGSNASGSNILIQGLLAIGTGADGFYNVTGGLLNFNTLTNFITIVGGVPALGVPAGTTLLTGTFSTFAIVATPAQVTVSGQGPDTKDPGLLIALGLSPTLPFFFNGSTVGADPNGPPGPYTAFNTGITNTAVPEPGTLLLLGSGLIALARTARKKLRRPAESR